MESLRFGPLPAQTDLDAAVALTRLLHEDFAARGTDHTERMNDEEVVLAVKAHRASSADWGWRPRSCPFGTTAGSTTTGARTACPVVAAGRRAASASKSFSGRREALEELREIEYERRFRNAPRETFKNLIFAAIGPKPKIVLRGAVNNDAEIVQNAENCLVYSDPLSAHGLTWRQMVTW